MASNMFLVPFLVQEDRGHSPTAAGALMATVPLVILAVAPLPGRLTDRAGPRRPATLGAALIAGGVALLATVGRLGQVAGIAVPGTVRDLARGSPPGSTPPASSRSPPPSSSWPPPAERDPPAAERRAARPRPGRRAT